MNKHLFSYPTAPLLQVDHLSKAFPGMERKAVSDVSFSIQSGETLALVGESGSGKTTLSRAVLGLTSSDEGRVIYDGSLLSLSSLSPKERKRLNAPLYLDEVFSSYYSEIGAKPYQSIENRGRVSLPTIVFQDPYSSFDERKTIYRSLVEPLVVKGIKDKKILMEEALKILKEVGLDEDALFRYPFEFSGGQCQRIAIARALIAKSKLVILDEPVSSLDLSVQNEVISLLLRLKRERGLSYLFIAHNLPLVSYFADKVAVMSLGHIVEMGECKEVLAKPLHPYTKMLLSHVPLPDPNAERKRALEETSFIRPKISDGGELKEVEPGHYVYIEKENL